MQDSQATDQSNLETLLASFLSVSRLGESDVSEAIQLFNKARELLKKRAFEEDLDQRRVSEIITCLKKAGSKLESFSLAVDKLTILHTMLTDVAEKKEQEDVKTQCLCAMFEPDNLEGLMQLLEDLEKVSSLIWVEINLLAGKRLIKRGNWYQGLQVLSSTLEQFRALEDMDGMARSFIEVGTVQELFGDYELARLSFLDAERLFKKAKREEGVAVAELQLGTLALDYYDYEQARPHLQFASNFFHQHGDQERAKLSDDFLNLADEFERELALV